MTGHPHVPAIRAIRRLRHFSGSKLRAAASFTAAAGTTVAFAAVMLVSLLTGRHHSPHATTVADTEPAPQETAGAPPQALNPQRDIHVPAAAYNSPRIVITRAGDTLSSLAQRYLGNASLWMKIWDVNPEITNPNMIYDGEHIRIPSLDVHITARRLPAQPAPQPSAPQTGPAAQPDPASGSLAGASAFQTCVAFRESTDNPTAQSPVSTASGEYGIEDSTWQSLGAPYNQYPSAKDAPLWMQNDAFAALYAADGVAPWQPSDGC
jgi:LysM repeat protein